MNVPALEVHIHAGERRERSGDKVIKAIAKELYTGNLVWINEAGTLYNVGIFIMWHGENTCEKIGGLGSLE